MHRGLLLLPCLLLAACVNYEEEFAISLTGGGYIRSTITSKADLSDDDPYELQRDMEATFAKASGLRLANYQTRVEGKNRITDFQIDFDHVEDLASVVEGEEGKEMAQFFGSFVAVEQPDRYVMTRTIDLSAGFEGRNPMAKKGLAGVVAGAVLSKYTFTYHMRFPTKVIGANSQEIDPATNLVTWRIPLTDALRGPVEMRAEVSKPSILKWALIAGGGVLAVAVSLIGIVTRRRRIRV